MLRLKYVKNQFQKRTLRVNYSQTKATPMDSYLHTSLGSGAAFRQPLSTDTAGVTFPLTRSANAFISNPGNSLLPGTVMVRVADDAVCVANGANATIQPYGLLANFVGGDFDELGSENRVGVWRGYGSEYTLFAPAFDDVTNGGMAAAAAANTAGAPALLCAGPDGRLAYYSASTGTVIGARVPLARLVERVSSQVIRVDLII